MNGRLLWIGRVAGVVGFLVCAVAGLARLSGLFWLGGFQVGTLLLGGIALMCAACVCFLWVLTARGDGTH
jgi:hypothetical protein